MKSEGRKALLLPLRTLFLSALSHGVLLVTLSFSTTDDIHQKYLSYVSITLSEFKYQKLTWENMPKTFNRKVIFKKENNESKLETFRQNNINSIIVKDSVKSGTDTTISELEKIKSGDRYLNFSRSPLDSLLISNPGYTKLILKERIKNLKDTVSIRLEWEKRINYEIHKYLREYYPEGSENAINKYTGPGINIPIDDLIEIMKGIF